MIVSIIICLVFVIACGLIFLAESLGKYLDGLFR